MFESILVANRGEIACRVIRTARRLGLRCVAVYSEVDVDAAHVALADSAYCIGAAPAAESYLKAAAIIAAAKAAGAQAIHPGYGFLSENADFAEACQAAGITFVGPPPAAIRAMGSKSEAKALMGKAAVPLVPGYHSDVQGAEALQAEAQKMGFPLMVKASAGGGGKGMRVVAAADDFLTGLEAARREAKAAFGDDHVLLERYLAAPRHIEIQVFRDNHGNAVHLFERDCSSQRRHQKVVEEAPAPGLSETLRQAMGAAAIDAAAAIDYRGAGTVEFLFDGDAFYFMEMNTRLQVEHPVTEMIAGVDLVEWQLRVAAGEALPLSQDQLAITGHAIEARVYAEDPANGFLPSTGSLLHLEFPAEDMGLRIDSGVRPGDAVSVFYDPMIAKIIAWGEDRATALRRLDRALSRTEIAGVVSNVAFVRAILAHPVFQQGALDTGFIDQHREALLPASGPVPDKVLAALTLAEMRWRSGQARLAAAGSDDPHSPWQLTNGWRLNSETHTDLTFLQGEDVYSVTLHFRPEGLGLVLPSGEYAVSFEEIAEDHLAIRLDRESFRARILREGPRRWVLVDGAVHILALQDLLHGVPEDVAGSGRIAAPMPGKVMAVLVQQGDQVSQGAPLLRLEAMKMEHTLTAPHDGRVDALNCAAGELVDEGHELVVLVEN
ncbi:acetyl-CoA carboxylase biotin carboxylase subunit [Pelagibius litoralis]|uniref:Acetyl-CoA carboxylase biotin carboxylase subunit n=1 Tax=Pelagibius litoralis TaxID=374515 RepID=A0A967F2J7_9PROT|nr:acetyl-CoA carboxylase biotin carboxylase subunit [Pelagibius litoralis]NIA72011.1 acetyl-CoA carboxylase biotin carboxylase subunit [Pelagibius litoralis]